MAGAPDWILVATLKEGSDRTTVGAGWNTQYGGISIRLNPCVQLTDRDDVWLLLKPADKEESGRKKAVET